ncbi:sensor domain-containing diguanylate cyclase [Vibrio japonicus]|uniref:diguanylate cyclase n=1 Tax=Vibrio japonicus TaxID=1824638 RepID=A0ABY5LLD3_9VIBR|nr:sensor domain-containing diguanylate cyclase [Vibrio japonicus]UUM31567.1 sensor domain-containing diguanylate cyclase [Vibrio japonicus]
MQLSAPKKFVYPLMAFLSIALVMVVLLYFAYQSQLKYTVDLFDNHAEQRVRNLQQILKSDLHTIGAGANYFHSTEPENWETFPIFAKKLLSSSDTLIGLQWMQKVEKENLSEYIATVKQTFPSFTLYTVPKDGPKTLGYIMPNNEPIYVASDIYPRTDSNMELLGFYSSRLRFQLVVDGIRATGQPSISDKVRLLQDGLDQSLEKTGLLVYHPVFDIKSDQDLIGVMVGVIRTTRYFDTLVTRTSADQELLIKVTDMGFDAEDDPILYESEKWQETGGMLLSKTVTLPNREWIVEFKLIERLTNNDRMVLKSVAIGGLAVACLMAYVVFLQVREKERLSVLLDERTQELQFLVNHDSLTGLFNRRAFSEQLNRNISEGQTFGLAAFDVDNFKHINDNFGHVVGDEMLIHVARVVESYLKPDDMFVRTGGDEFSIISKVSDKKAFYDYLLSIIEAVELSPLQSGEHTVRCTLSMGGIIRTTENEEDALQKADVQLYLSKNAGRNKVTVAD